ncbi:MAG: HEPN domain-containing protein [Acidobacteriia bacterium]|nr:HEPN domain-containing protein [Terriglobia bacterium]
MLVEKAHKDLRCAQIDLAADPPAPEDALYHCQQAAEKALKGFLVWRDQPFPKTHDLGKLGKQAVEQDQTLEPLVDEVVEFTKYAWMFRYPGDVEVPSVVETVAVLHRVRDFVEAMLIRLPEEAR